MGGDAAELVRNAVVVLAALGFLTWFARDEDRAIRSARITGPVALVLVGLWLGLVAFYAPIEKTQGIAQKIFYAHVPPVPAAYLGFVMTAVGGIAFLRTRRDAWDRLALASAEVGVLFCTLNIVTGPIWAKPIWGHWWVWDLRLTSALVLWFIYLAYLFLRALAVGSDTARTFASIYGIAGTAGIPFVYYAVDLARGDTLHPENPARHGLPLEMALTALAGVAACLTLYCYFTARRLEIARLEASHS